MERQNVIQKLKGLSGPQKLFLLLGVNLGILGVVLTLKMAGPSGHSETAGHDSAEHGEKNAGHGGHGDHEESEEHAESSGHDETEEHGEEHAEAEAPVHEKDGHHVARGSHGSKKSSPIHHEEEEIDITQSHTGAHGAKAHGHAAEARSHAKGSWWGRLVDTYGQALTSVQDKIEELRRSEEENRLLRLENAQLRLKMESMQFDCHASDADSVTKKWGAKLSQETGSRVGRALASIHYRPPGQVLPPQLFTLGVSYFKAREDEKAAVIFTFLTGLEEIDTYKTPKNHLLTGVAWYRLDNFEVAETYFDKALAAPAVAGNLQTQAHARLWKSLVNERLGKHSKAQYWLTKLLDHHPHSTEAGWVNSAKPEAERGPASGH